MKFSGMPSDEKVLCVFLVFLATVVLGICSAVVACTYIEHKYPLPAKIEKTE